MAEDKDDRSATALDADRLQEQLVNRSRVWQFWAAVGFLALGVWLALWKEISEVTIMTGVIAWAVFAIHLNFTQILHELYEINDQLAGRKDEFKATIQRQAGSTGP